MIDQEQYEDTIAVQYTCRRCAGKLRAQEFDGEHEDCEPRVDEARRRESIRRLHQSTALLLKRMGFLEEAQWHQTRGER